MLWILLLLYLFDSIYPKIVFGPDSVSKQPSILNHHGSIVRAICKSSCLKKFDVNINDYDSLEKCLDSKDSHCYQCIKTCGNLICKLPECPFARNNGCDVGCKFLYNIRNKFTFGSSFLPENVSSASQLPNLVQNVTFVCGNTVLRKHYRSGQQQQPLVVSRRFSVLQSKLTLEILKKSEIITYAVMVEFRNSDPATVELKDREQSAAPERETFATEYTVRTSVTPYFEMTERSGWWRLEVVPVSDNGVVGRVFKTPWFQVKPFNDLVPPKQILIYQNPEKGNPHGVDTFVHWIPSELYPSCYYILSYTDGQRFHQIRVQTTNSFTASLGELDYGSELAIEVSPLATPSSVAPFYQGLLKRIRIQTCLEAQQGPGEVNSLRTNRVGQDEMEIDWKPPDGVSQYNPVSAYAINLTTTTTPQCPQPINLSKLVSWKVTSYKIDSGLTDGCRYELEISALNQVGKRGVRLKRSVEFAGPLGTPLAQRDDTPETLKHPKDQRNGLAGALIALAVCISITAGFVLMYVCWLKRWLCCKSVWLWYDGDGQHMSTAGRLPEGCEEGSSRPPGPSCPDDERRGAGGPIEFNPDGSVGYHPFESSLNPGDLVGDEPSSSSSAERNLSKLRRMYGGAEVTHLSSLGSSPHQNLTPLDRNPAFGLTHVSDLGGGFSGRVFLATTPQPSRLPPMIAVKELKNASIGSLSKKDLASFKREIKICQLVGNGDGIVKYLGHRMNNRNPQLYMEYCEGGKLKDYLVNIRRTVSFEKRGGEDEQEGCSSSANLNRRRGSSQMHWEDVENNLFSMFISYTRQIARGMEYISSQGVVHRDLAVRNVLLCDNVRAVRIADFGLAIMSEYYAMTSTMNARRQRPNVGFSLFTNTGNIAVEETNNDGKCPGAANGGSLLNLLPRRHSYHSASVDSLAAFEHDGQGGGRYCGDDPRSRNHSHSSTTNTSETVSSNHYLPFKWMPPEAIEHGVWNQKTDIWSFGVTMWEIFSLGDNPLSDFNTPLDVLKFWKSNYRIPKPSHWTSRCKIEEIYGIMEDCWGPVNSCRPTFHTLRVGLEKRMEGDAGHYLSLSPARHAAGTVFETSVDGSSVENVAKNSDEECGGPSISSSTTTTPAAVVSETFTVVSDNNSSATTSTAPATVLKAGDETAVNNSDSDSLALSRHV